MNKKGFTLSELLMVVVVLGILSAIALPRFAPQKEKAYVAEAVGMLSAIRQLEESYRLDNGFYLPIASNATTAVLNTEWLKLGIENPNISNYWKYTIATTASTCTITATRQNLKWSGSVAFANQTVTLSNAGVYAGNHPNVPQN